MGKGIIALLSFILGGGIGIIITSCFFIEKEMEKDEESKKDK